MSITLLAGAPAVPLLLAILAALRLLQPGTILRLLPLAPLPGLAAALLPPYGEMASLPDILLGAGLVLDPVRAVFLGVASFLWMTAGAFALSYMAEDEARGAFGGFWLATLAGNLGIFVAADLVTFYLSFALLSLAAFGLVIHEGTGEARRAGRIYIILAVLGETCLLAGFLIAAFTADGILLGDVVAAASRSPWRDTLAALLLAGFGIKAGLVPLHVWLPLAHPAAPVPASAVLSGAIIKAGIFGLMVFMPPAWGGALVLGGLITAYFGILVGVTQGNPKTILAYSTLSQMGVVMTVVGAGRMASDVASADAAATFYAAHHGLAKGALFLAVGVLAASGGQTFRWAMVATAAAALAIAGLPLSGGALAKLAVKDPLGTGIVPALVTLSAVGTTLLMLRFLRTVRRKAADPEALTGFEAGLRRWSVAGGLLIGIALAIGAAIART